MQLPEVTPKFGIREFPRIRIEGNANTVLGNGAPRRMYSFRSTDIQ
jgi:hypothetical protein